MQTAKTADIIIDVITQAFPSASEATLKSMGR